MTVQRILFIRPGETDWNRAGKQQGGAASPLNTLGRRQAEKLDNMLRVIGISALYSSTTRRAAQTAEIIAAQVGYAPIMDERLRERSVGQWQGLTVAEIRDWYPDEYAALLKDVDSYSIPGGDSRLDVQTRMKSALDDILKNAQGETIAIISHTTAIKMALRLLVPGTDVTMQDITNTSVTTVAREADGTWRLIAVDDVLHLEGMESMSVREPEDKS
jgi:broad specificity phosphatase PhoE